MDFSTAFSHAALGFLGAVFGIVLSFILYLFRANAAPKRLRKGIYAGGLPVVAAVISVYFLGGVPHTSESEMLVLGVLLCAFLGFLSDMGKISKAVLLPYLLFIFLFAFLNGLKIEHASHAISLCMSLCWPLLIIAALYIASYIFSMPSLLCLGSGLTFLSFFSGQFATPPAAFALTSAMIVTPLIVLVAAAFGYRIKLRNSGHFALGWLLAGVSMLGKSKTLLLIGLLVPAAIVFLPLALVSLVLVISYLGNELYEPDPARRRRSFSWHLPRKRLVVIAALIFLIPNFAILLYNVQADFMGYCSLALLGLVTAAWFIKLFARKRPTIKPEQFESPQRIEVLGSSVDALSRQKALELITDWIRNAGDFHHIITADSLAIERARHDREFAQIVRQASLVLPDGAGLVWALDVLGAPIVERIAGVSLVEEICRAAAEAGQSVYFIGAKPGVAEAAAEKLRQRIPKLSIAGLHHGYFTAGSDEEAEALETIAAAEPRVIFVAMGVPRQEKFIAKLRSLISGAVAIGIGGSLDVISGRLPRAPLWMQKFALEWLFRLYHEPSRFKRMMNIPVFVGAVIRQKLNYSTRITGVSEAHII